MQFLDYTALKKGFNRTAKTYKAHAKIAHSTQLILLERLDTLKIKPKRILDVGSGSSTLGSELIQRYPQAEIFNLDLAEQRLQLAQSKRTINKQFFICADAHALPFTSQSFDLIVSNLCWYWMDHLGQAIYEAQRVLKVDGTLLFTTLGPDTLRELRAAFYEISPNPHINHFFDMHDIGDALLKAGFADPVMDVEYLTQDFNGLTAIFRMLQKTGETNYLKLRHRAMTSKKIFKGMRHCYKKFKNQKTYPATFEIIFGYAWCKNIRHLEVSDNEISVPLSKIQRSKST
jgi:malonyl-CoA O-methyltransferase